MIKSFLAPFDTGEISAELAGIVAWKVTDIVNARRVASDIAEAGAEAMAVEVDVSAPAQVHSLIDQAISAFGRVDILHNNAVGATPGDSDVVHMDLDAWDTAMTINLRGYLLGCRAVLPHMLERGQGVIVNTSSNSALAGDLTRTAYGVSKAGINTLTTYVAAQYGRFGIRCNAISPGLVMTPKMEAAAYLSAQDREIYQLSHLTPRFAYPQDHRQRGGLSRLRRRRNDRRADPLRRWRNAGPHTVLRPGPQCWRPAGTLTNNLTSVPTLAGGAVNHDVEPLGSIAEEVIGWELEAVAVGQGRAPGREQVEKLLEGDLGLHTGQMDAEAEVAAPTER
jgi:NAD(P)-dependent dehydrogenase (short-subunit alcohol dehydrogenase family)